MPARDQSSRLSAAKERDAERVSAHPRRSAPGGDRRGERLEERRPAHHGRLPLGRFRGAAPPRPSACRRRQPGGRAPVPGNGRRPRGGRDPDRASRHGAVSGRLHPCSPHAGQLLRSRPPACPSRPRRRGAAGRMPDRPAAGRSPSQGTRRPGSGPLDPQRQRRRPIRTAPRGEDRPGRLRRIDRHRDRQRDERRHTRPRNDHDSPCGPRAGNRRPRPVPQPPRRRHRGAGQLDRDDPRGRSTRRGGVSGDRRPD